MNARGRTRLLLSVIAGAGLAAGMTILHLSSCPTAVAGPAASTWFASSSGGGAPCTQASPCSLDTAIGSAAAGDTIYVEEGTYTGSGPSVVTLTSSITLYGGWDGSPSGGIVRDPDLYPTTLDGEEQRRVVFISGAISPTIDGFIITRGNASNAGTGPGKGGGIYSLGASPVIANNVIRYNVAYTSTSDTGRGGGIYLENFAANTTVEANEVFSNSASTSYYGYGGGIGLGYATQPLARVVGNVVISNTASITGGRGFGGGISTYGSSGAIIEGNTVEHNFAKRDYGNAGAGGGIYCFSSGNVAISGNTVQHNTASLAGNGGGGGVYISGCDGVVVRSNILQNNLSTASVTGAGRGGGLNAYYSLDVAIEGNWVLDNVTGPSTSYGGGLYLGHSTSFTMSNNVIANNLANTEGGGMAFEAGPATPVTGTVVYNTFADNDRGTSDGGRTAIYMGDSYVTLVLTNNILCNHAYGVYGVLTTSATLDHALFYSSTAADTGGAGNIVATNSITGQNPLLNPSYHISEYSPAFNAAIDIPWVTDDIDGNPRPLRGGFDIGADERGYAVYLPLVLRSY